MIGQLNPVWKKVNVIGGGISGMLMTDHLLHLGYEVTLYEKSDRLGGLISTKKTPHGNAESAAHSLLVTAGIGRWLSELGVELYPLNPKSRSRFIYRDGKRQRLPLGILEAMKIVKYGFRAPKTKVVSTATLAEWTQTYLGQDALYHLIAPFCYGIYAAEPSELVASIAFPKFSIPQGKSALGHFISKKKTERPSFSVPAGGMSEIIQKLEARMTKNSNLKLHLKSSPQPQELDPLTNWVLTMPAHAASDWLAQLDPMTSKCFQKVRYSPLVSVTVFCKNQGFEQVPTGVGVLSSHEVRDPVLGILFNSSSFAGRVENQSHSSFTVMLGGTRNPRWVTASDEEIQNEVKKALNGWLGYRGDPLHLEIHRWPRAVPLYNEALMDSWNSANQGFSSRPGRVFFGNYTGQVSIRGLIEELLRKVQG